MRETIVVLSLVLIVGALALVHELSASGMMAVSSGGGAPSIASSGYRSVAGQGFVPTGSRNVQAGQGGLYPEVCTNGLDDDLDRKVDCEDSECRNDLACRGGCQVSARVMKLPGQKICKDKKLFVCEKVASSWQLVEKQCPAGKKCFGNGVCV